MQVFYFINKGAIRTFFIDEDGQEVTQHIAFENETTTSFNSFMNATNKYNPLSQSKEVTIDINYCDGCGKCATLCPKHVF